jgi:hypothetical protein
LKTIVPYVRVFAALTVAVLVLAPIGEAIREATPVRFHFALSAAGAMIAAGALIALGSCKVPPFAMSVRAWRVSMSAGLIAGFLLFCFYVSDVECATTPRGGFSCHYVGSE